MNTFTASNGVDVAQTDFVYFTTLEVKTVDNTVTLAGVHVAALREFYRAGEDARLGRWRWPEEPNWVCYPAGNGVVVFNEDAPSFGSCTLSRGSDTWPYWRPAASAYFDAHPEPKPAWHDAKPGEVWAIRRHGDDEEIACLVETFQETFVFQVADAESITTTRGVIESGRRIWPEDAS
ncbi:MULTISPECIES: hypothetical protein [unclassified Microbacterium]|uniref:hypothetical protein n=1 Tax=unclassified Microbacterium TaxID=2609290 RepID=UPI00386B90AD